MNLRKLINIFEATTPAQGVTGQKIAQTSGGQFVNRADRTNQAKVDAALGPGFKAGSAQANTALAKKFSQPAAAPTAAPAPTNVPAPSAGNEALKGQVIGAGAPNTTTPAAPAPTNVPAPSAGNEALKGQVIGAGAPNTTTPAAPAPTNVPAPSAGNEALKGQVIGAGAPSTTTPAARSGAAAALASKSAAPAADASTGGAAKPAIASATAAPGRDPGLVNAVGIQGQATNVAGADALTGGTKVAAFGKSDMANQTAAPATAAPAAAAPAPTGGAVAAFGKSDMANQSAAPSIQGSAAGYAPAAPTTAPAAPSTQGSAAGFAPAGGAAKPGSFSATGMAGTDFEESVEEELEEEIDDDLKEMLRLSGLPIMEKAVSKQQQKFMGMAHAMQKGERVKGASAELKAAAKGMSKKDAKDFASTKHKGLPKKVTEGVVLEAGSTLEHIVNKFKYETKKFINGEDLDSDLYEALFDYYSDNGEIPYGVAKARDGDPYTWIENRFEDELSMMGYPRTHDELNYRGDRDLTELALLAGLTNEGMLDDVKTAIDKATLPKAMHGEYDRLKRQKAEREFEKSGSAYTDNSGIIYAMDGNQKVQPALPTKDYLSKDSRARDLFNMQFKESVDLNECGDMGMDTEDKFNVSTNMSSDGTRSVNISAQGDRADELLQMLKMAGMRPHDDHDHSSMREPEVIMIGSDDEMMEEDEFGSKGYIGSKDPRVAGYQDFINKTAKITGSPNIKVDGMFGSKTMDASSYTNNFFMHHGRKHPAAEEFWHHQSNLTQHGIEDMEKGITKPTKRPNFMPNDKIQEARKKRTTRYVNTPDEEYQTVASITRQGNDLNREKRQYAGSPKLGDNPMAESGLDADLDAMLESILVREEEKPTWLQKQPSKSQEEIAADWDARVKADKGGVLPAERPYKDEKTGRMVTPPRGATNPPPDSEFPPGDKRNMMPPKRK